jgi:hypothetical protein
LREDGHRHHAWRKVGKGDALKLIGCFLLLAGWLIVLAALVMLAGPRERMVFVTAGFAVEILGLTLLTQGYRLAGRSQE